MSTIATPGAPAAPVPAPYRVTLPRVIRSEWIKLRSVRSTVLTFGLSAVAVAAFGVLFSMFSSGAVVGGDGEVQYDAAGNSLLGTNIAQLVLGSLGAVLITSEYATGLIRATLTAVPKRLPVLWAKMTVVAAATFATMVAAVSVAFFAGQALYRGDGVAASITDPDVPRALLAAALYPTAIAVMGLAFGFLLRNTATAVGILFGMLFIVPLLLQSFGGVWVDLGSYLPSEAGQAMTTLIDDPNRLSPAAGFVVLAGWVGALSAGAAILLRRRDA